MGLMKQARLKANNEGIAFMTAAAIIIGISAIAGVSIFAWKAGSGVEQAFTLFGQEISLYVVVGGVVLGMMFLYLVFGKD